MRLFYQNRELAKRFNIPLNRWKRWSREFLPPDPLGGLQSGYARQYRLRDAFIVYLGGFLVSRVGFSIPEARKILQDLNGWLQKNIIEGYASGSDERHASPRESEGIDLLVEPVSELPGVPAFTYRIRFLVASSMIEDGNPSLWQERYHLQVIKPASSNPSEGYPTCIRRVDLGALVGAFFRAMGFRRS